MSTVPNNFPLIAAARLEIGGPRICMSAPGWGYPGIECEWGHDGRDVRNLCGRLDDGRLVFFGRTRYSSNNWHVELRLPPCRWVPAGIGPYPDLITAQRALIHAVETWPLAALPVEALDELRAECGCPPLLPDGQPWESGDPVPVMLVGASKCLALILAALRKTEECRSLVPSTAERHASNIEYPAHDLSIIHTSLGEHLAGARPSSGPLTDYAQDIRLWIGALRGVLLKILPSLVNQNRRSEDLKAIAADLSRWHAAANRPDYKATRQHRKVTALLDAASAAWRMDKAADEAYP